MVTDEEVEAAARAMCEADGHDPDETHYHHNGEILEPYGPRWMLSAYLARAALLAAEAARKPDLVPGLEMARRIVRESDFLVEAGDAITLAIEVVTSPSPEHPVDDDALVRRLDGLPQP
jgi:hypothetical protein